MRRPPGAALAVQLSPDIGNRPRVYLSPGQLHAAEAPTAITTVLGSCVAVCLHDPVARVGGMNHFLLPHHVARERSPRFGTSAVPLLVDAVLRAGAARGRLAATVFGGASVLGASGTGRTLGRDNAELAIRLLGEAGIPVRDADVGGTHGRKLVFLTDEGTAWVRVL